MKLIRCDICEGKDLSFLFEQKDKNLDDGFMFSLYQCQNCKTILTSPRLSPKDLKEYYPKDYYAFDNIITKEESHKINLKLALYNIFYNEMEEDIYTELFWSPFKFLIRGTKIVQGNKLLDIGCGSGQFLYEMKECGMDVYGIEPAQDSRTGKMRPWVMKFAQKYNIKPDLYKAKYSKENFDLITMNHVLQHVDNPSRMLKEVHRVLKEDGLFIVSASNTRSLASWLFKRNWFQLDVPRHLFNCKDKTLIQFLENHDFKVTKNRHNSRPNQFVVSLYHVFDKKNKGGIVNRMLEIGFLPLTWIVNVLKVGDQVELWCKKNGGGE